LIGSGDYADPARENYGRSSIDDIRHQDNFVVNSIDNTCGINATTVFKKIANLLSVLVCFRSNFSSSCMHPEIFRNRYFWFLVEIRNRGTPKKSKIF